MKNHLKRFRVMRGAFGLSVAAASVVGSMAFADVAGAAGTVTPSATAAQNNIIIGSGSSTTYPMMMALDSLYNQATGCALVVDYTNSGAVPQPFDFSCLTHAQIVAGANIGSLEAAPGVTANPFNDVVVEEPPIGSSNGIVQLTSGLGSPTYLNNKYTAQPAGAVSVPNNINFARSSRAKGTSDDQGLNFVAYAADGVDWAHYSVVNNKATNSDIAGQTAGSLITKDQATSIYNGKIFNWSQVGGTQAPIVVFSSQSGSGTQDTWKGAVGFDPSAAANKVNCYDKSALVFNATQTSTTCYGPIDVFENQTGTLSLASLPTVLKDPLAASGFNAASATADVTVSNVLAANAPTTITAPAVCNNWWLGCTAAKVAKTGNGTTVGTFNYKQTYTLVSWATDNAANRQAVQSDLVQFYSTGLFNHQCQGTIGATFAGVKSKNTAATCAAGNYVNYAVDGTGKTTFQLGQMGGTTPTAGATSFGALSASTSTSLGSCPLSTAVVAAGYSRCIPTQASVLSGDFAVTRSVFNVYSNGSQAAIAPASGATLAYVSETGFICSTRSKNMINPLTGNSYTTDIQNTILGQGFYPLSAAKVSGGLDQNPLDEGAISHYATGVSTIQTGNADARYAPYVAADSSLNGHPAGFCIVTETTDGKVPSL